jgi:DnaJ-domain-containing protein 1
MPSAFGAVVADGYEGLTHHYKIEGGKLITYVAQEPFAFSFYQHGDTHYAARSNEFGYANYQIIAAPQTAVNPLTEVGQQFAVALGLTQQQKQQVLPILDEELKQLMALKKNTALSGSQKVEKLREVGATFDQKISPLLNAQQQARFQSVREQFRQRLVDQLGDELVHKLTTDIHWDG